MFKKIGGEIFFKAKVNEKSCVKINNGNYSCAIDHCNIESIDNIDGSVIVHPKNKFICYSQYLDILRIIVANGHSELYFPWVSNNTMLNKMEIATILKSVLCHYGDESRFIPDDYIKKSFLGYRGGLKILFHYITPLNDDQSDKVIFGSETFMEFREFITTHNIKSFEEFDLITKSRLINDL